LKKLLYISPLPRESQTGGANAVNYHIYKQLQRHFGCTYLFINPPPSTLVNWVSKFRRRVLHLPGKYSFYSPERLEKIEKEFRKHSGHFDLLFFRGFTPWIGIHPPIPWFAYNDTNFRTYFENTFNYRDFEQKEIDRIYAAEEKWLSEAKAVFFESEWGKQQCLTHCKILSSNFFGIGRGGDIPIPEQDTWNGSKKLLFMAKNFFQKGGDLAFEAFRVLNNHDNAIEFHVVGGPPDKKTINHTGVVYHGFLTKENPEERDALVKLLSEAMVLLHPTREDINPLVITEAGYFGCPTVSVDKFAIPELVIHQATGLLLPYLPSPEQIGDAVWSIIKDRHLYLEMRKATREFNLEHFSWDKIGARTADLILQHL